MDDPAVFCWIVHSWLHLQCSVLCFSFVSIRSVSCACCCLCLWIVHFWLPLQFSVLCFSWHRQQRAQDTERIETKLKHNTKHWRCNQEWPIQRHRQQRAQDTERIRRPIANHWQSFKYAQPRLEIDLAILVAITNHFIHLWYKCRCISKYHMIVATKSPLSYDIHLQLNMMKIVSYSWLKYIYTWLDVWMIDWLIDCFPEPVFIDIQ
jgi:hypothetical protein